MFMKPTTTLFRKKNIKNGSHGAIYMFKNYFTTVFSVFSKISCIQTNPKFWFETNSTLYGSHPKPLFLTI